MRDFLIQIILKGLQHNDEDFGISHHLLCVQGLCFDALQNNILKKTLEINLITIFIFKMFFS